MINTIVIAKSSSGLPASAVEQSAATTLWILLWAITSACQLTTCFVPELSASGARGDPAHVG